MMDNRKLGTMSMTRHDARRGPLRLTAAMCCLAWIGCDQFAAIGIQEPESDAAPSSPAQGDAGETSERDSAILDGGDAVASDSSAPASDAGCAPVEAAVCNPVTNEGCSAALQMQCAVSFDAPLTGYCIFFSGGPPPALGGACLNTVVTESCPAKSTCVAERCRTLCFCDADCEAGQCCTEPLQSTGFKVCGDCR
jgi:hypothetical protein